ncbi:TPA: three-Cys-motif partner protein TcmP [bacterium]|nr:three-Cys-motif partner protein TcmP [bacterium]
MKHEFGGNWTEDKLERLQKYLLAYMTIFSENPKAKMLKTIYVDAFAGTGYRSKANEIICPDLFDEWNEKDSDEFLKGSPVIALEIEPSFKQYIFIEQDSERYNELQNLKQQFHSKRDRIEIIQADANKYLRNWCEHTDWIKNRAVIFLDPYGMQVEWSTIEAIAGTKAIDLWLLFPIGMSVNRMLTRKGIPPDKWVQCLNRIFGTEDWQEAFYATHTELTLFGEDERQTKEANYTKIGQYFVDRLKTIFEEVANNPLTLRNSKNVPLYLLCFAASNPRGSKTAIKIASHILKG